LLHLNGLDDTNEQCLSDRTILKESEVRNLKVKVGAAT